MRRWMMVGLLAGAALLAAGGAQAQSSNDRDDDSGDRHRDRFALGVGVGLVEPLNKTENYYMASLRIRFSGRGDDESSSRQATGEEGIIGYLEPEIGYWSPSGDNPGSGEDLLLGVNLVGVIPLGPVDTFLGVGAGAHFIDATLLTNRGGVSGSETKLGANAQFGLDLFITRKLSAFGVGRFDLVQGSDDRVQSKVYLGLRARF